MEIKKGTSRIVVLLPLLGLAVKFPIIHPIRALRLFIRIMRGKDRWKNIKLYWRCSPKAIAGFKGPLFKGIVANWKEFVFYQQTKNIFLNPTYLSVFGLMNIQPIGKPFVMNYQVLGKQLDTLTKGKTYLDAHCFTNTSNFCCNHYGKLRILDYSSDGAQAVIREYGEKIHQLFDFSYTPNS